MVFPPGVDHWRGVTLVMQPPLQAHMNIAVYIIGSLAVIAVTMLAHELLGLAPEDRAGRRERAWYPEF